MKDTRSYPRSVCQLRLPRLLRHTHRHLFARARGHIPLQVFIPYGKLLCVVASVENPGELSAATWGFKANGSDVHTYSAACARCTAPNLQMMSLGRFELQPSQHTTPRNRVLSPLRPQLASVFDVLQVSAVILGNETSASA